MTEQPAGEDDVPAESPNQPPGQPRVPLTGPPLMVRRLVFTTVLLLVAASVAVAIVVDFRAGGYVLAAAGVVGGVARAVLPDYLCLGLLVRSRRQDAVTLLLLGIAVAVTARSVPNS